nr:hypothetical protein [Methylobacterium sp. ZNC0032]
MAWTQTDIDRLKRAIATGARRVEFGSGETRRVQEFHSIDAMLKALAAMEDEVSGATGLVSRRTVAGYNSGL